MAQTIIITGGARSGKSHYAEGMAQQFGTQLGYLATAKALDSEMSERIKTHQARRGNVWHTIEEPLDLSRSLTENDGLYQCILIDCLTLWLSNILLHYHELGESSEARVMADVHQLLLLLKELSTPVIIVSNEVGMGIVPENRLARMFRDIAGQANQLLAAEADEVWLVVSGIPIKLK